MESRGLVPQNHANTLGWKLFSMSAEEVHWNHVVLHHKDTVAYATTSKHLKLKLKKLVTLNNDNWKTNIRLHASVEISLRFS